MTARPITGRKVLVALLAFFGVVALANAVFIVLSLRTFPGVETEDAYRKGLAWDRELDAAAVQRALGWKIVIAWQDIAPARGRITVRAQDRDGAKLRGLAAEVTFRRAVHAGEDRRIDLMETAPGLYGADVALPGGGDWRVTLHLRREGRPDYRLDQRIEVP